MLQSLIKKFNYFRKKSTEQRTLSKFFEVGFHGDIYLLSIVDYLFSKEVTQFIETGSNVGSTLAFVGSKFPKVSCLSCEPDVSAFSEALKNTQHLDNVNLFNQLSQDFLADLLNTPQNPIFSKKTLFWIDAHGYGFEWPLKEEVNFILNRFPNCYILIDDFKVPHLDVFNYDRYKNQICSFEYISSAIPDVPYELYYPNYTKKTSTHHSLQGWGLIIKGIDPMPNYKDSSLIINHNKLKKLGIE